MENEKDEGLPFKDFLDKSTNLITLFGVFNALIIYSATLDNEVAVEFTLPAFFILSLLVWFELIMFTVASSDGSKKYEFFSILLFLVELGLVWYFIVKFAGILFLLVLFGIFFLLIYLIMQLLVWVTFKILVKTQESRRKTLIQIIIAISIILSGAIIKFSSPLVRPFLERIIFSIGAKKHKQEKPHKL